MRYLTLLFIAFTFAACHGKPDAKEKWLQDTLAKLHKLTDFKPLPADEAYDFINKYYLPTLDSLPIHRTIFVHPLNGKDFQLAFKNDSASLRSKYLKDSFEVNTSDIKLYPPPTGLYNATYNWAEKRFVKTKLASDSLEKDFFKNKDNGSLNNVIAFHKKFGAGYMIVSYPQYNAQTNKLIIEDWLEDAGWCGTGKERKYWFKKTSAGWEELKQK